MGTVYVVPTHTMMRLVKCAIIVTYDPKKLFKLLATQCVLCNVISNNPFQTLLCLVLSLTSSQYLSGVHKLFFSLPRVNNIYYFTSLLSLPDNTVFNYYLPKAATTCYLPAFIINSAYLLAPHFKAST